jgi:poly(3-hydroxybutyrate) depolymerase
MRRMRKAFARHLLRGAVFSLLLPSLPSVAAGAKVEKRSLGSGGKERVYYLYVPAAVRTPGGSPVPLLVTLHGSGRNGASLVEKWTDLADRERIVVAGPDSTDSQHWSSPADGPEFLRDLVEEIRGKEPIDPRRIYLFGHSAGALFAIQIACLESEYFAAAAVHAGALRPAGFSVFDYAKRKIPIHMAIGDRDPFFPVSDARATRDALVERGFPAALVEMSWHTHDYSERARAINESAWEFLSKQALAKDPSYTTYRPAP